MSNLIRNISTGAWIVVAVACGLLAEPVIKPILLRLGPYDPPVTIERVEAEVIEDGGRLRLSVSFLGEKTGYCSDQSRLYRRVRGVKDGILREMTDDGVRFDVGQGWFRDRPVDIPVTWPAQEYEVRWQFAFRGCPDAKNYALDLWSPDKPARQARFVVPVRRPAALPPRSLPQERPDEPEGSP